MSDDEWQGFFSEEGVSEDEYYHVRITTKSDRGNDEVKLDLSKANVAR